MLKEIETEETIDFFVTFLSLLPFNFIIILCISSPGLLPRGVARDGGTRNGITWCHPFLVQKKVFAVRLVGFGSKRGWRPKKTKNKGLHHKSVELWFHIIVWCHPKIVSPQAGRLPCDATTSAPLDTTMALAMIVEICLIFRYDTVL